MRRKSGTILAGIAATAALGMAPREAAAEQLEAYLLFELTGSDEAAIEGLRSTSLANCKQLPVGQGAASGEVIFHLVCSERDSSTNMSDAVARLARVDGVKRALVLTVKVAA